MPGDSTTDEYATQTAEFLDDDPAVAGAVGGDVIGAVCTPPSRTTIGTNFLCFGEAATFGPIEFSVEIDAIESFLVTDFRPAPSPTKIILVDELVTGLTGEDLLVDQICVRQVVDDLPDTDAQVIVDNIDAPQFPEGLSVDEDDLTTLLIDCVSGLTILEHIASQITGSPRSRGHGDRPRSTAIVRSLTRRPCDSRRRSRPGW